MTYNVYMSTNDFGGESLIARQIELVDVDRIRTEFAELGEEVRVEDLDEETLGRLEDLEWPSD